jgi:hypothetical protein
VKRPAEVTLVAIYYAGFSVVLLGVLGWQTVMHPPSAGWIDAAPPLLFCLLIAVIPAVISVGLWILDDAARIGSVILAIIHGIVTIVWLSRMPTMKIVLPWIRLVIDGAIVLCMVRPGVQRAFKWRMTELRLR